MIVKEIYATSILSKSKIFDYVINPYTGCQHACSYCYARFMKRFTGHKEPWGEFVDVKVNGPDLLKQEINRKPHGRVWISGVCDPYQPLEKTHELTKRYLEILVQHDFSITVQTKSPLVLRDLKLLKELTQIEVGLSVTTGDERVRRLFEPGAPPIEDRIKALEQLRLTGIRTFVMIAPLLPEAEKLAIALRRKVDYALIDRMNYHYGDWVYKKYKLESAMSDEFFSRKSRELASALEQQDIECHVLF